MIIDLPTTPASIEWTPNQAVQTNRPEFGDAEPKITVLGQTFTWSAKVAIVEIRGEAAFRPWRSALMRMKGGARAFRLSACEGPQHAHHQVVVVDGAGQQGNTIALRGFAEGTGMRDGMFLTVVSANGAERLLAIVADTPLAGADGKLVLSIEPVVPTGLVDGDRVETRRPWATMRRTDQGTGWRVGPNQTYTVSFECEGR